MRRKSTTKGFKTASALVQGRVRGASESRGFAQSRLLTHWAEIVGADIADLAVPLKVSYGKGLGATLTVLTTGAKAPMLQAQLPQVEARVNACYGYRAISKVRITQTAPTGFSEGQIAFQPKPKDAPTLSAEDARGVQKVAKTVENEDLRAALTRLGENVLRKERGKRKELS